MSEIVCSPNAAITFDFLTARGLTDFQAAAVVGNLQHESGLDPALSAPDPRPTNPAAMGRGIAMWGDPGRWRDLLAFAAARRSDPWALETQLDFLWAELPSNGLWRLRATTTLEEAVVAFQDDFERPNRALAHTDRRIAYARAALVACPATRPPIAPRSKIVNTAAAAFAGGVLAALAGIGIYKTRSARKVERKLPPPPPDRPRPQIRRLWPPDAPAARPIPPPRPFRTRP